LECPHSVHSWLCTEHGNKRLNLLRSMTSQSAALHDVTILGQRKGVLLTMYKALILCLIDYGCQAYESASTNTKSKLCVVQSKALRICCGSMRGTSCSPVQVECGVMPLSLRRENLSLKYALKLTQQRGLDNSATSILVETWHQHHTRKHDKDAAFATRVNPILLTLNLQIKQIYIDPTSWKLMPCGIDISLSTQIKKQTDNIQIQHTRAMLFIGSRADRVHLFSDGARSKEGWAASEVSVPSARFTRAVKLSDGTSVFTAEIIISAVLNQMAMPSASPLVTLPHYHILKLYSFYRYVHCRHCLEAELAPQTPS